MSSMPAEPIRVSGAAAAAPATWRIRPWRLPLQLGWTDRLVATGLAAASLAVTLPRALDYALWQDEVGSARLIVRGGFGDLLHGIAASENHPPGFYVLAWALHHIGAPVIWGRGLSVAATAVLAAFVYLTARELLPRGPAALAGLVIILGWQFEMHGWELRPYALFALASFAALYALHWAALAPTWRRCGALAIAVAAGACLHDFVVFTVVTGALWLAVSRLPQGRGRLFVSLTVGLAPLLLWTPGLVEQYRHHHFSTLPAFDTRGVADVYAEFLERHVAPGPMGTVTSLGVLVLVIAGAARLWRDPGLGRLCALGAVVPVAIGAFAWAAGPHVFAPRAFIGVAPFAAIAIAAALTVSSRALTIAATLAACTLLTFGYARADGRITPDYDRVAAALAAEGWRPQNPIVLFGPLYHYLIPLDWYLPGGEPLETAAPNGRACPRIFVVAVGLRGHAVVAQLELGVQHVRSTTIGALEWRADLFRDALRDGGIVLGTRQSGCLRLVAH